MWANKHHTHTDTAAWQQQTAAVALVVRLRSLERRKVYVMPCASVSILAPSRHPFFCVATDRSLATLSPTRKHGQVLHSQKHLVCLRGPPFGASPCSLRFYRVRPTFLVAGQGRFHLQASACVRSTAGVSARVTSRPGLCAVPSASDNASARLVASLALF